MGEENGVLVRMSDLERRVTRIEDLKPDVVADRVETLTSKVSGLTTALYTAAFSFLVSVAILAVTMFLAFGRPA